MLMARAGVSIDNVLPSPVATTPLTLASISVPAEFMMLTAVPIYHVVLES